MSYLLITIYCLLFTFLAWRNFFLALVLFFLLLPTYLIRFYLGPLPTTLLEIMLWIVIIFWLIKYKSHITYHLSRITKQHPTLFIAIGLFLLAATISVFTSSDLRAALGEWKAFYIEPVIIFLILITTPQQKNYLTSNETNTNKILHKYKQNMTYHILFIFYSYFNRIFKNYNLTNTIICALILSGLITSLLAIYQHFTGWLVPDSFWQNQNTFRVTAWYGYPNAVGLFLAPLIPLSLYLIKQSWVKIKQMGKVESGKWKVFIILVISFLFPLSSFLAILFSRGSGPLVGLAVGLGLLLIMYKKTRWPAITIGAIGILSILVLSGLSSTKQELLLQDRSGQIRLAIWSETWEFLKDHPLSGAGLASYAEKIQPYHQTVNDEGIEIFHHPHNILLTMYVNLGLLGLIAFILIIYSYFKILITNYQLPISNQFSISKFSNLKIYLGASMLTFLVMGLVDSPYIKNDLAIFFWLLPALLLTSNYELEKSKT